jgi:hypothetical protein
VVPPSLPLLPPAPPQSKVAVVMQWLREEVVLSSCVRV